MTQLFDKETFNAGLCDFLGSATTPFHAVTEMIAVLSAAGFEALQWDADWNLQPGGRYFVTRNDSSIIAYVHPKAPKQGLAIVGAHTDSPCLMVKPNPELTGDGYLRLGVQVYGGALLNPWFDRDLSLAGRVSYLNDVGELESVLLDFRRAIASVPSLAIHLDRDANKQRSVNPQTDMPPVVCHLASGESLTLRDILAQRIREQHPGRNVQTVLDYELAFYDTQAPAVTGLRGEFISSARLDNLLSCYIGLQALLQCDAGRGAILVCNDHEEVGSQSAVGAQGPFLLSFLKRIASTESAFASLAANSLLVSCDNAHGIHPNYSSKHDENHGPLLNAGPVIKVNANQRYASNSETSAFFRLLCSQEEVAVQTFVVRSDMGCGSTIGPISAAVTGIATLDIGVPTFAMHSIRELAGADDPANLARVLARFYNHSGALTVS